MICRAELRSGSWGVGMMGRAAVWRLWGRASKTGEKKNKKNEKRRTRSC